MFPGEHAPGPPTTVHLHCPHATPTKNPGYAPVATVGAFLITVIRPLPNTIVPRKKSPTTCQSLKPHNCRSTAGMVVGSAITSAVLIFVFSSGMNTLFCPLQWRSSCNSMRKQTMRSAKCAKQRFLTETDISSFVVR